MCGSEVRLPTVCHVLHGLRVGGAEILAARLARRLAGEARSVFACLDAPQESAPAVAIDGAPVYWLARRAGFDVRCVRRLASLLARESVDLVHAHNVSPFRYSLLARRLGRRRPALLFTEHGRPFPDPRRRRRILLNRMLLEGRDRVVAVGEAVRAALVHGEGLAAGRVTVIHNGVAAARQAVDREAARSEIGVGPGELLTLQVARLDPVKDHPTALRALRRVVERHPAVRLAIAGEGPERGALEEMVAEAGLGRHVRWLGFRTDVSRLLGAADLFLLTSQVEGLPLALLEAMAAGLPAVATRVGCVPEAVEEGETGLLASAGDDIGLAEGILRLARDPGLRRRLGQAARRRVEERFEEDRMIQEYRRLYRQFLAGVQFSVQAAGPA